MAPIKAIVLDIEGTTTPITFVHDVLFPYIRSNLEAFLTKNWETSPIKTIRSSLFNQFKSDEINKLNPPEIETGNQESLLTNILWQMNNARKSAPLKDLQGLMWEEAYKSGQIKGIVYQDVLSALQKWNESGILIYIYSSGSINAQKLLFRYCIDGDLSQYFSGNFDTTIGGKLYAASYRNIQDQINLPMEQILFLSDNVNELLACREAKMGAVLVQRTGNAPLQHNIAKQFNVVSSFDDIIIL